MDTARTAAVLAVHRNENPEDDVERLESNAKIVEARTAQLTALPFGLGLSEELYSETLARLTAQLVQHIEQYRDTLGAGFPEDLAELGVLEVFKAPDKHLNTTGLVFAGFGDHEIFPALTEFKSCGVVCGKHIDVPSIEFAVTHNVPARLFSFAQTAMSDTFALGVSEDVYLSIMSTLGERLNNFERDMISKSGGDVSAISKFDEVVAKARRDMGAAILDKAQEHHALPLRRVLGVLPVDEIAELAETLINLQALKEKVTKSSETVGGPVDLQ